MFENLLTLFNLGPLSSAEEATSKEQSNQSSSALGTPRISLLADDIQTEKASNLGHGEMDETHARRGRRRSRRARSRRSGSGRPPVKFW